VDGSPSPDAVHEDLVRLVRQAQEGSAQAAQAVFDRCRQPLLLVIRRVIDRPLRRLYDSDDFLLSTFKEIFTRHFSDEVLRGPHTLWPYIKRIAENKVHDAERKFLQSARRQLGRQVTLAQDFESNDLSPAEVVILKELVEERLEDLVAQLPDLLQGIVELLREGKNGNEVAESLGVHPKRVYRAMDWLKRRVMEE
jgi:DNA-directed RNA polymerase specialized sigma24 family protein